MSYDRVIDAIQENGLRWNDVDRILLNEETYDEFRDRASFETSDHLTEDAPAVRVTEGAEKIVWVADNGIEFSQEL